MYPRDKSDGLLGRPGEYTPVLTAKVPCSSAGQQ